MFQSKKAYYFLQRGKQLTSMVENVSKDNSEQGGNGNDARGLDVKQLFFSDFVATISSNHIITTAYLMRLTFCALKFRFPLMRLLRTKRLLRGWISELDSN